MSTFAEVLAWIFIGCASLPLILTLITLATGLQAPKMRHGRATTMSEAWPDISPFLPVLAIGISLLAHQWNPHAVKWWLAQLPLFALAVFSLGAGIRSWIRHEPGWLVAGPDIRSGLVALAFGASLLSVQWTPDTVSSWLAQIPLFVVVLAQLASWLRSRIKRSPGKPTAEPS
jgi:hypothetical protein